MIDENRNEDPDHRSESRSVPFRPIPKLLPGAVPNAPKRNALVLLAYLFVCVLVAGLLRTVL
ncbi:MULTISPECIES: hypothetical protein [Haloferacaceae]|uniref:Uncharacterized protein n=1 Tax=Halorubrum glutamatedens TaxID=2707018 RepID=A0ABD5QTW7_9EURY|nr:hypothetical protein [Halobellus captivus]